MAMARSDTDGHDINNHYPEPERADEPASGQESQVPPRTGRRHVRCPRRIRASGQSPEVFIGAHVEGCWGGELCEEDRLLNEEALIDGSRLFSAYSTLRGEKVWIITEAVGDDGRRSATTILLPEEY